MKQHKRAVEVSVAPLAERSEFQETVHRWWKPAAGIIAVAVIVIVARQWLHSKHEGALQAGWDTFADRIEGATDDPAELSAALSAAAAELQGTEVGAWAGAAEVVSYAREREFAKARAALDRLRENPDASLLLTQRLVWDEGGQQLTLADHLESRIQEWETWSSQNRQVFENPELPPEAPRVRLKTTAGDIVIGLYTDRAPAHCANFLELARSGYYDQTRFHRIVSGKLIQGGDPNSKEGEPETWGQGGPEVGIAPEESGLWHFKGVLAAAKRPGQTESSGSQFYITLADAHDFDERYVVYGTVVEGMSVVETIGKGATAPGTDRPEDPVTIESVDVL